MKWSDLKNKIVSDWTKAKKTIVDTYESQNNFIKKLDSNPSETEKRIATNIREYAFVDVFNAYGLNEADEPIPYPVALRWRLLCNQKGKFDGWTPLRFFGNLGRLIFMYPARFLDFKCRQIMLDKDSSAFTRSVFSVLHRVFQGTFLQMRAIFAADDNVKKAWAIHPVLGVLAFVWSIASCLVISPWITAAVLFVSPVLVITGLGALLSYVPWGPIGHTASHALQVTAKSLSNAFSSTHNFVTAFISKYTGQAVVTSMEKPSGKIADNNVHQNMISVINSYVNALKATFVTAKKTYGSIKNWLFGEEAATRPAPAVFDQSSSTGVSRSLKNGCTYNALQSAYKSNDEEEEEEEERSNSGSHNETDDAYENSGQHSEAWPSQRSSTKEANCGCWSGLTRVFCGFYKTAPTPTSTRDDSVSSHDSSCSSISQHSGR